MEFVPPTLLHPKFLQTLKNKTDVMSALYFPAETKEKAGKEGISNKEIPRQCPMWISLEVGYFFLLNINGQKTSLGDLKKKLKISALLKNEESVVRKPLPMGNTASTRSPPPTSTALSQERSQQSHIGGKCSLESLKYPKFQKKSTVPRAQVVTGLSKAWK